jgi:nucleotide-binding universal stress UspA family protein
MFSNIVVGTDGSPTAEHAVALASDMARRSGATLHLVTACNVAAGLAAGGFLGGEALAADDLSMSAAEQVLAEVAAGIEGVELRTHAVSGGAAPAIVRVAEEVDADVIVVGSRGMTGAHRAIGSVPNSVAHSARCHVLIAKTT